MTLIPAPALDLSVFTIGFAKVQGATRNPYTGKLYSLGDGGFWRGTVGWDTSAGPIQDRENLEDLLIRFHAMLAASAQPRIAIPLPRRYRPDVPASANVVLNSAGLTADGMIADITVSEGAIRVGDFLNVGERLYTVRSKMGNAHRLLPNVAPADSATVEVKNPVAIAEISDSGTMGARSAGTILALHVFDWNERVV